MDARANETAIVIVGAGAGLAGLTAAVLLTDAKRDFVILEARAAAGGRVRLAYDPNSARFVGDLGPTWIWPEYQPTFTAWLNRLHIATFAQFNSGAAAVESSVHAPPTLIHLPGQTGQMRIVGGTSALVDALLQRIAKGTLRIEAAVMRIRVTARLLDVEVRGEADVLFRAHRAIIAVPPRIAAAIDWQPGLPQDLLRVLNATPTWMASHAKAVIVYESAFWRERGLSGRIASRVGPLVEAHDHCHPDGTPAALTGFVGWTAATRRRAGRDNLDMALRQQLSRLFGADAPEPTAIYIQDWAEDAFVCTAEDVLSVLAHPATAPDFLRDLHANGRIAFAASETASIISGLVEGAFVAAHSAR